LDSSPKFFVQNPLSKLDILCLYDSLCHNDQCFCLHICFPQALMWFMLKFLQISWFFCSNPLVIFLQLTWKKSTTRLNVSTRHCLLVGMLAPPFPMVVLLFWLFMSNLWNLKFYKKSSTSNCSSTNNLVITTNELH